MKYKLNHIATESSSAPGYLQYHSRIIIKEEEEKKQKKKKKKKVASCVLIEDQI